MMFMFILKMGILWAPYKHVCASIMHNKANIHNYVYEHFLIVAYCAINKIPIYVILDGDMPVDDNFILNSSLQSQNQGT